MYVKPLDLRAILEMKKRRAAIVKNLPKPTVRFYITLFEASPKLLYIDYFESFKLLVDWLGKPESTGVTGTIPSILGSYSVQEIAKHLDVSAYEVMIESIKLIEENSKR